MRTVALLTFVAFVAGCSDAASTESPNPSKATTQSETSTQKGARVAVVEPAADISDPPTRTKDEPESVSTKEPLQTTEPASEDFAPLILKGHTSAVWGIEFSPDGKVIASASDDTEVKLWDARTGKEIRTLVGHAAPVHDVAFSPDGLRLATGGGTALTGREDYALRIWEISTGTALLTLKGHISDVQSIAYSPDGKSIATASWDTTAIVWDAASGERKLTLRGHDLELTTVAFSPDGKRILTASLDKTMKFWDAKSSIDLHTIKFPKDVYDFSFNGGGTQFAVAVSYNVVALYDMAEENISLLFPIESLDAHAVAFSRDGKRVAVTQFDKTVRLFDAVTGKEQSALKGHTERLTDVKFSPDGSRVASSSHDKTVIIQAVP